MIPFDGNIFHMSWNHLDNIHLIPLQKQKKLPLSLVSKKMIASLHWWGVGLRIGGWRYPIIHWKWHATQKCRFGTWFSFFQMGDCQVPCWVFFLGGGGNWKLFWLIHWQLKAKMEKNTGNWHAENCISFERRFWMITVLSMIHFVNLILSRIQVHKKGIHCFWMFYSRMINATFILDCQCL